MSLRDKSNREIARGKVKREGDRSSQISRKLMQLKEPLVRKLEIDLELKDAVNAARAITSPPARRRAERTLAGELRRYELAPIEAALAKVHEAGNIDAQALHLAEQWRARLIEEGITAAAELPQPPEGTDQAELVRLIDAARKERDTGKPPGAQRKLFRHVVELLTVARAPASSDDDEPKNDEADEVEAPDE